jgi:hypothetical protein
VVRDTSIGAKIVIIAIHSYFDSLQHKAAQGAGNTDNICHIATHWHKMGAVLTLFTLQSAPVPTAGSVPDSEAAVDA